MLLRIEHETRLTYSSLVAETVFEARMAPPSTEDQTVLSHGLKTSPQAPVLSYRDGFNNRVELFNLPNPYSELVVKASSLVRTHRRPADSLLEGLSWPSENAHDVEALDFLQPSPLVDQGPGLTAFLPALPEPNGPVLDVLKRWMHVVRTQLKYEKKVTTTRTPLSEVLQIGCGVCQDFSHLFIGACRALGVPARYVSGYVHHPGELATHAWCQVWVGPRVGWVDVDPTAESFVGDDHVVVAVGRDYADVPPNRGVWKGQATETINVAVKVEPVDRVPLEWNDWAPGGLRPVTARRRTRLVTSTRAGFVAYPNQRPARMGLHQQQAEQQQQGPPTA